MNQKTRPVVTIETLGCKLNQAESELLARSFLARGYHLARPGDGCDVYVLNTCTVTHVADRKARNLLRQAKRQNPNALVVATGCLAERAPGQIAALAGIDLVVGNDEKDTLPVKVEQVLKVGNAPVNPVPLNESTWGRTRAMVKIQEGCSQSCSYCIVPRVRGKEKSLSPPSVIEQVKALTGQGYKEIVLTGSDIGSYQQEGSNLVALLKSILQNTRVERLRLSSLQSQEISPELLSLWQDPRLCRHVHLPLQSGSDPVLQAMRRRYNREDFHQAATLLQEAAPDMAITTDVIVGFPRESASDFELTKTLCKDVGFARIHAFPYSPRPGTLAATITPRLDSKVQSERLSEMLELARVSSRRFKERFLDTVFPVLWERPVKGETNLWSGLTGNYIRVYVKNTETLRNQVLPTRLIKIEEGKMWGELL